MIILSDLLLLWHAMPCHVDQLLFYSDSNYLFLIRTILLHCQYHTKSLFATFLTLPDLLPDLGSLLVVRHDMISSMHRYVDIDVIIRAM